MMIAKKKNKILLLTLCTLFLLAGGYSILLSRPIAAPDVRFKTITNKTIALNKLRGKVVLITFWASNCASCLKEIPDFISLYNDYQNKGLEIIAIAMYYDRPNFVVDTAKVYDIPYDIALDLDMKLATAFGDVSFTPTTFLINPKGEIIFQETGIINLKAMQKRIELALGSRL